MLAVVTPAEMAAIDAAAPESAAELIGRAGAAVARTAVDMLGGTYGRRVIVIAGKGSNGADGRVAAAILERRGVRTVVFDADATPSSLPAADLVIDAGYGTGVSRPYRAPVHRAPVLAVDLPSGIDGITGVAHGQPSRADVTLTFSALKPGLLFADGPTYAGHTRIADIGLDNGPVSCHLIEAIDVALRFPVRDRAAHKWHHAALVVAGSPTMPGAARLVAAAAQRVGAGMVQVASPGFAFDPARPTESVSIEVPEAGWADQLAEGAGRIGAMAIGPGLGTSLAARHQVRSLTSRLDVPVVLDGDALTALGRDAAVVLDGRIAPAVLTPHDGEFERLSGSRPGLDRIADARSLAATTHATVLLKGPTTVVASPTGACRLVRSGDERLATAGSGDVLTGIIVGLLAMGLGALDAASLGAHIHGVCASVGPDHGVIASDLVAALPVALEQLVGNRS